MVTVNTELLTGIVPGNKEILTGMVPVTNIIQILKHLETQANQTKMETKEIQLF